MELAEVIRGRRSVRAFAPKSVGSHAIERLLETARWAPSWANTQSWCVYVTVGASLERIKRELRARTESNTPRRFDIPAPKAEWPAHLAARTRELLEARDSAIRATALAENEQPPPGSAELFGAPAALLLAVDRRLQPEYACFDCGLWVETLCLAAHDQGLGTCIMAMAVGYPEVLREVLPNAQDKRFVVAVALGYPDWDAPINQFARRRAELGESVTWVG